LSIDINSSKSKSTAALIAIQELLLGRRLTVEEATAVFETPEIVVLALNEKLSALGEIFDSLYTFNPLLKVEYDKLAKVLNKTSS
jgi:hypothetical protein